MAKITLRNFEELIVSEEKARALSLELQQRKEEMNAGGLQLSFFPITIDHVDGMWFGSLQDIGPISRSEKSKEIKHNFKSEEDLKRFHNEYGYGVFHNYNLPGYGMVDIRTQFLIKTNQAKFDGNKLIILNSPHKEKWNDLWFVYQSKLDEFNELT